MNKFNLKILKVFIIFCFCQGLLFYLGIPNIFYKAIVILFSIFFLFLIITTKRKIYTLDKVLFFSFLYFSVIIISGYINNSDLIDVISYSFYFLTSIVVYMCIKRMNFSEKQILSINNMFFLIFIVQIFASIIKFFVWGTSEAIAGTIHYSGGSLNTIVPLVSISMLLSFFLIFAKKKIYLLLILGFFFMAWTGEKRGIYFYFIIVLAFTLFSNNVLINNVKVSKIILFFLLFPVFSFGIIYLGATYAPTLNPEGTMGGSFDIDFIYNYVIGYTTSSDLDGFAIGRFSGLYAVYENIVNSDLKTILVGNGPSAVLGQTNLGGLQYRYGVASFLGVNGWSTALISIGFIGAILVIIIYTIVGRFAYTFAKYEKDLYWRSLAFGLYIIVFVFFLDFFTYTRSFYHSIPLNVGVLYFYAVLKNRYRLLKIKSQL